MRSTLLHGRKGGKRTSRGASRLSAEERRRLFQLGISLAVFALALLGRSAFPQQMEKWSDLLMKDINLEAALTRFEESTAQGEPFLDALGELCIEVFTAEETGPAGPLQKREESLLDEAPGPADRYHIWNEFRESQWQTE